MATLVAVIGLLVTMVFNTTGVFSAAHQASQQAQAARDTRLDTQVSLLTSLSAYLQTNDLGLARPEIEAARCNPIDHPLNGRQRLKVLATLGGYDYLAWLLNQNSWGLEAAKTYWAPRMLYALDVAQTVFDYRQIEARFRQLEQFRRDLGSAPKLIRGC